MNSKNSLVYHYSDLNAFLNIIKTRSLWMSDVKKSNDSMEGKYLAKKMLKLNIKKNKYKQLTRKIYALGEIERTLRDILSYSPYYKQSSFEEEKEYRLICVNDVSIVDGMMYIDSNFSEIINSKVKNFKLSKLKTRVVRESICSYYELSFMPVHNDIIGEIIIGPKSKVTTADIEYILSLYGYNQTDIEGVYGPTNS